MSKKFIKRVEDFECAQCGAFVHGDGYTNHCPKCLYSQHVDIYPGDRAAQCGGLMVPIALDRRHGEERIIHRCLQCGHTGPNRVSSADDLAVLSVLLVQSDSYELTNNQNDDE